MVLDPLGGILMSLAGCDWYSFVQGKRLGRGIGSGKGKTSGRGHKGQKARTGPFFSVLARDATESISKII